MTDKVQNYDSEILAEADENDWIKCPNCSVRFKLTDRKRWTGYCHKTCGQRIRVINRVNQVNPVWCVVGNIAEDVVFGEENIIQKGTKHFSPGTKVYCYPPLWGDGYENIKVIARHRGSKKFVTMVIRARWLVNCRAKLIYNPDVLNQISGVWDGSEDSKELAEELSQIINVRNTTQIR
jgi:hypothetical protein